MPSPTIDAEPSRVVRVLPDEPGINKVFDYLVPAGLDGAELIQVGTMVRFSLHGRRMGGWIVAVDVSATAAGEKLRALTKVTGIGPPAELFALADWASWRWWGRPASFLRTASPERAVRGLANVSPLDPELVPVASVADELSDVAAKALADGGVTVLRSSPDTDPFAVIIEAVRHGGHGGVLVIAPSRSVAVHEARRLRRAGVPVALLPDEWARARAGGCTVIGARAAAWAPMADPGAIVVLDEHDEAHAEERMPTWHARDVAVERARRAGVPCLLVSPCPTVAALAIDGAKLAVVSRSGERAGWPPIEVIDRSGEQPGRQGLLAAPLGPILRTPGTVLLVLNRTGRSKMLACRACGQVARCERCGGPMEQPGDASRNGSDVVEDEVGTLACGRCGDERPLLCLVCGSGRLNNVRMGVSRAREEIEALALRPVAEVTGGTDAVPDGIDVLVGTEALLHRVDHADVVVFLDFDSELLAARYRGAEQALALLVRAGRLVGGRGRTRGRVVVQTRLPRHEVLVAAVLGDPERLAEVELARRESLRFPPFSALAAVSGAGSSAVAEQLRGTDVELLGPDAGPFLVRATSSAALADALSIVDRPAERVRIEVDPLRI